MGAQLYGDPGPFLKRFWIRIGVVIIIVIIIKIIILVFFVIDYIIVIINVNKLMISEIIVALAISHQKVVLVRFFLLGRGGGGQSWIEIKIESCLIITIDDGGDFSLKDVQDDIYTIDGDVPVDEMIYHDIITIFIIFIIIIIIVIIIMIKSLSRSSSLSS